MDILASRDILHVIIYCYIYIDYLIHMYTVYLYTVYIYMYMFACSQYIIRTHNIEARGTTEKYAFQAKCSLPNLTLEQNA